MLAAKKRVCVTNKKTAACAIVLKSTTGHPATLKYVPWQNFLLECVTLAAH